MGFNSAFKGLMTRKLKAIFYPTYPISEGVWKVLVFALLPSGRNTM
jgi:hypothetical protein